VGLVADSISEQIADFAVGLRSDDIPENVRAAAKLHVLDTIGCGLAAHALSVGRAGQSIAGSVSADGSTVIGRSGLATAPSAALANGMLCHALDFDDTHSESICHVSVVATTATLAVAESVGASGDDFLAAVVVANEVITRVGAAAAPGYMVRGFHPTSVCGVFGATAGAARLLGLSRAETTRALGIAGSMAAGLFAYLGDGSLTKPIHAGRAAEAGVTAALLARGGGEGPRRIFEDRFGFYAAYYDGGGDDLAERVASLGDEWETLRIAYKAYPACHFVHGCLDGAARAHAETGWSAAEIESVSVAVPDPGIPLVLEPLEAKRRPRTDYDAKFSVPYSVAAMLVRGRVDLGSYLEAALTDSDILAVAERVGYQRRRFDSFPGAFPGWIRVRSRSGFVFECETEFQRGAPENALTDEEVVAKFRRNAALAVEQDVTLTLEQTSKMLEDVRDVRGVFRALACESAETMRA
jgi:2-methylcitrate dehydratase PrpD